MFLHGKKKTRMIFIKGEFALEPEKRKHENAFEFFLVLRHVFLFMLNCRRKIRNKYVHISACVSIGFNWLGVN